MVVENAYTFSRAEGRQEEQVLDFRILQKKEVFIEEHRELTAL